MGRLGSVGARLVHSTLVRVGVQACASLVPDVPSTGTTGMLQLNSGSKQEKPAQSGGSSSPAPRNVSAKEALPLSTNLPLSLVGLMVVSLVSVSRALSSRGRMHVYW